MPREIVVKDNTEQFVEEAADNVQEVQDDVVEDQDDSQDYDDEYDDESGDVNGNTEELSVEERARIQGWRPKDEFRGNEDDWIPADQYIKNQENNMPLMRSTVRKLEDTVDVITRHNKELQKKFEIFEQSTRSKLIKELESKLDDAVLDGDSDAVKRIISEMKSAESPIEVEEEKPQQQKVDPTAEAWVSRNTWFNKDQMLQGIAVQIHQNFLTTRPDLSIAENLELVSKEVKKRFPEKFGIKQKRMPKMQKFDNGETVKGQKTEESLIANMSEQEKRDARVLINRGLYKDIYDYAKKNADLGDSKVVRIKRGK